MSHFVLMTVLPGYGKYDPRNVHLIGSQLVTLGLIKELKILRRVLSPGFPTEHQTLYTLPQQLLHKLMLLYREQHKEISVPAQSSLNSISVKGLTAARLAAGWDKFPSLNQSCAHRLPH